MTESIVRQVLHFPICQGSDFPILFYFERRIEMALKTSNYGINLIKRFEGCRLSAYRDTVGVVTIGYGWTNPIDGKPLTMNTKITQEKAETLLREGLKPYEAKVNKYDSKYHWNQNQFDALVSFCYNLGNIDGLTANGTRSINEIANKFTAYNKAGGRVIAGLTSRRNEEKQLFLSPSSSINNIVSNNKPDTSSVSKYTHKNFVKDIQASIGAKVDGVAGPETLSKTVTVSRIINNRHAAIRPIQKYLNSIGYDCGNTDGIAGQKFEKAVKLFQKSNRCVSDGEITAKRETWKKLLKLS